MAFFSQSGLNSAVSDIIVAVFLGLLSVLTIAALIVLLCKYVGATGEPSRKKLALALVLAAGFAIRLAFGLCVRGNREAYAMITDMFAVYGKYGLGEYYNGDSSTALYPVTYLIYLIFGGLSNAFGATSQSLGAQFFVKLPLIIADIFTAFAVYKIAKRYFNTHVALVLCGFVCVSPIFFIGSSVWTTPLAITACFACYACYFLARKNYAAVIAFATAAAFSSKEGIYLFPIVAVYSVFHIVRGAINIRKDKPRGRDVLKNDYVAVIAVPVSFVLSVACAYLIGLFMISSYSFDFFKYIYEFLLLPLVEWKFFTCDGVSIYSIFGRNGLAPGARFPSGLFVGIFAAILFAIVCVVYFTKRNRATLVMFAAYCMLTMELYYPNSSGIGLQSALVLILAAYALVKDKRLLHVLFAVGLAYVVNAAGALAQAGYLNNFADYTLSGDGAGEAVMVGALSAVPIVCSVIAVVAHLYFTVIAVNIGMTGRKRLLGSAVGIGRSLGECFSLKR